LTAGRTGAKELVTWGQRGLADFKFFCGVEGGRLSTVNGKLGKGAAGNDYSPLSCWACSRSAGLTKKRALSRSRSSCGSTAGVRPCAFADDEFHDRSGVAGPRIMQVFKVLKQVFWGWTCERDTPLHKFILHQAPTRQPCQFARVKQRHSPNIKEATGQFDSRFLFADPGLFQGFIWNDERHTWLRVGA